MRPVTFVGDCEVTFQSQNLGSLRNCNDLLHDNSGLHSRIEEDGYLLIRSLINRETVIKARKTILSYADENGELPFKPDTELMDAVYNPDGQPAHTMGEKQSPIIQMCWKFWREPSFLIFFGGSLINPVRLLIISGCA